MKSPALTLLVSVTLCCLGALPCLQAAPAFPGAVGFGKDTIGGRSTSATIYFVTRLDDYDAAADPIPGTLRHALEASGPRIVVFKTGGVISLKRKIIVDNPYLTILGQTAPGDGIAIRNQAIRFVQDEVIMRSVRVRPGDTVNVGTEPQPDQLDGIQLSFRNNNQATNLIFDHCSVGWTKDEIVELYFGGKNVTFSNCTFAEALWHTDNVDPGDATHGYGPLLDGGFYRSDQITFYRCLFAHNQRRNPWIKAGATCELVNNVLYNWETEGMGVWQGSGAPEANFVNLIGNYFKPGPDTKAGQKGIILKANYTGSQIHISGNIGPGRPTETFPETAVATISQASSYLVDTPIADANSGISAESAFDAFESVMNNVGALPRDAHDARVVANARNGDGTYIDSISEIDGPKSEGYPVYDPGTYPTDTDNDGMPDEWETVNGLDPSSATDATEMNAEGYLWIEVYANSLIDPQPTIVGTYLDTWSLYSDGWADTEHWLHWLWIEHAPWVYSNRLEHYVFVAEDSFSTSGAWLYLPPQN